MAIDISNDTLQPLGELLAARLGKRPSPATIWRWRLKGVSIRGQRIRLEAVRVGGEWRSTPEAVTEFFRAQTAAANAPIEDAPTERSERTRRKLEVAGLL